MSNLSKRGPDTLDRYFCTLLSEQLHFRVGCPKYPQGQGFIAAITKQEQGYVTLIAALVRVIFPSSIGCLKSSLTSRLNSGSSSKNKTPLCAIEISPGCMLFPPPESPAVEMLW